MAVVLMPEAAMYKDDRLIAGKDEVGFSGQMSRMQPETQAGRMQCSSDNQFGLCMTTFDRRHVPAACFGIMDVGHPQAASRCRVGSVSAWM